MTMRRADHDNSRFHLGYLPVTVGMPVPEQKVQFDHLDIRFMKAVFDVYNGGMYHILQAKGWNSKF